MAEKGRLFLFDGTAIIYRAFYGIDATLTNSKGEPTNAVFGTARMMSKFVDERVHDDDYAVFAFDRKEETHRHKLYQEYKATRKAMPDGLVIQLPAIPTLIEGFGINFMSVPGLEADDIIATLVTRYYNEFREIIIISGDKDILQLVDDKIHVLRFVTGLTEFDEYSPDSVKEKMGVHPSKVFELLSMSGDTADNIPGIPGIGLKTAQKLLEKYGDIESIYKNIRQLSPSARQKLIDGKKSLESSQKLVKLVTDGAFRTEIQDLEYRVMQKPRLRKLFIEYEFSSLLKEYDLYEEVPEKGNEEIDGYRLVGSRAELNELLKLVDSSPIVSFDLETTSLDPHSADIVGVSISIEEGSGYYIPVGHKTERWQVERSEVIPLLKKTLEKPGIKLIGQNLKYDYEVLKRHGIVPPTPNFDSMLAAYKLNPDSKKFNMDDLALKYLGYRPISFEELMKRNQLIDDFANVPLEEAARYSIEDADVALRLYGVLSRKIYDSDLEKVLNDIELKLIPVIVDLELNGVYMNTESLKQLSDDYRIKMDEILGELFELTGENFNPNSPSQVSRILFDKLGLLPPKKTKQGSYSTSADVLEELIDQHPAVQKLLDYRKYQKLKSTYLDTLPLLVNPLTGRIHTSYHQTGTGTGRLSSSNPNMQNLPIRDEAGKEIRKCVVPQRPGWRILSADYSQIELRVLAHCSGDEELTAAFNEGRDVHALTASRLYGVDQKDVSDEMRRVGKMVNFSIIYGISAYGLSKRLGIKASHAENMISNYFNAYPGVRQFISDTIQKAREDGFVTTIFGRRRDIPQLKSSNRNRVQEGERIAINTPIQGTAADIMKLAMIKVFGDIEKHRLKLMTIMQVHDELVFEVPEEEIELLSRIVRDGMTDVVKLNVPLEIDISIAEYWN